MNIGTMQFKSKALGHHVTYTVSLPYGDNIAPGPYPVLYQLHGGSDDHTAWVHFSKIISFLNNIPLIVVFPDGALSSWANLNPLMRFEDFLMDDLATHVKQTFHATNGRWAIGGLSMGGFGGLRLGLKYPDRFCSIWTHSSSIPTRQEIEQRQAQGRYYGADPDDLDIYALVEKLDSKTMPRLSFDCGVDDFLIEQNRRFHRYLLDNDIPHSYAEHPGKHTWDYWETHVHEALQQHIDVLGLAIATPEKPVKPEK